VADGNGSPLLPDDAVLGGLLLFGEIPAAFLPDLFLPQRQPVARAMLAVAKRLGWCPVEAVKQEMAAQGAGVRDLTAIAGILKAAALPDELPDLIDALEHRARRKAATEAPTPVSLSDALDALLEAVKSGPPKCVPTPFPTLNRFLAGGFAPGELAYIGGRAGTGKSAFALELARHAAKAGRRVLIISREMLNVALARRMLAQEARVRATALKTGHIGAGEWVLLDAALSRLRGLPVWLTDQAASLTHIEGMAHGFPPPLDLLIVDYLQLLQAPVGIEDIRLQVQAISRGLKALAVGLRIPVVCLSSLARQQDGKEREPTMSALKESSNLEHDPDLVLLLHRKEDEAETSCRVAKNRDGETGKVLLRFRAEYVTFEESSDRQEA
jgi:replicative DNA helicase